MAAPGPSPGSVAQAPREAPEHGGVGRRRAGGAAAGQGTRAIHSGVANLVATSSRAAASSPAPTAPSTAA